MEDFEGGLKAATTPGPARKLVGVALLAADKSGQTRYRNEQGFTSVEEDVAKPFTADTIMWLASSGKLMTIISALQCLEKGLLSLDEDVTKILPELASRQILTRFEETGEPILREASKILTLRQLLTHTNGMGYDFMVEPLGKWSNWTNARLDAATIKTNQGEVFRAFDIPLIFEPGEGWEYSPGIDWVGKMVERVSGGMPLGEYMRQNIWTPLGMNSTTFHPIDDKWVHPRLSSMTTRTPSGDLLPAPPSRVLELKDNFGGGRNIFSSASDYMKVLIAILKSDGILLKPETMALMFQPQLSDPSVMNHRIKDLSSDWYRGGLPASDAWNFSLAGILNTEDIAGVCKKGTVSWSGLPSIYWWIDPTLGNCGLYASQLSPIGDRPSMQMNVAFRREMYKRWTEEVKVNAA